jgi:hypothetical protein
MASVVPRSVKGSWAWSGAIGAAKPSALAKMPTRSETAARPRAADCAPAIGYRGNSMPFAPFPAAIGAAWLTKVNGQG